MSLSLKALLRYWRAALLDGNRHIDTESLSLRECSYRELAAGHLGKDTLTAMWAQAEQGLSRQARAELKSISLVAAMQMLEPEHLHSASFNTMKHRRVPLWICFSADRDGRLYPPGNTVEQIIIDRAVIAPLASGTPTFTTLAAVDTYLDKNPPPAENSDWAAFWAYAAATFSGIFGEPPERYRPARHVSLGPFVACGTRPADTSRAIRAVYDHLIDSGSEAPPLLTKLIAPPSRKDIRSPRHRSDAAGRHLGQMGGEFPLNDSQRLALDALLISGNGDIIAVNGPPGTGKTTFIESAVASLWVEHALKENGEPPVILASSTNNKAITNILDTFARATLPDDHPLSKSTLVQRWLPKLTQYGLYLPSKREAGKGIKKELAAAWCIQHGQPWSGLPGQMENDDYVRGAAAFWLGRFEHWAGSKTTSLSEAVETLRQVLAAKASALKASQCHQLNLSALSPEGRLPNRTDIDRLRSAAADQKRRLDASRAIAHQALQLMHGSLIESLLSWLPAVRRRLWARTHAFLAANGVADPLWGWETALDAGELRRFLGSHVNDIETELASNEKILASWDAWIASLRPLLPAQSLQAVAQEPGKTDLILDVLVRPELFHLAGRYWEGRWLIETAEALVSNAKRFTGRDRETCEMRWRRFAKLSPCLVSTAYTAPRLFDYFNGRSQPLTEFVDLLIIDEAGQVPPQAGAALFAFARKALVVGDTQQLEPVWGIDADTDIGNLEFLKMSGERSLIERSGLMASEGSVMAMAQAATAFTLPPHRGLFLEEHWRCRPSVIAFCNELAYRGALKPMRRDSEHPLPPLGYAHVPGRAMRNGLSWTNADEAAVLAQWLARRQPQLIEHHRANKLGDVLAVVTPFRAQIPVLSAALQSAGLDQEEITVGTVHTLQGAEKPVVLFSAVYGAGQSTGMFFDRGVSMLNVAVSRARESFLVFGDLRLFRPEQPSLPSGLLASYLFSAPENEITDIDSVSPLTLRVPDDLERLASLDAHRNVLRSAIIEAQSRVLIVSPYLSHKAIEADDLGSLIRTRRNNARVVVAYDRFLNSGRSGMMQSGAAAATALLESAGAELWALNGVHNKTIAVDDSWIVEGSFNWLSALRNRDSAYQRHEVSFLYRGKDAPTHVNNAWQEAESFRIMPDAARA